MEIYNISILVFKISKNSLADLPYLESRRSIRSTYQKINNNIGAIDNNNNNNKLLNKLAYVIFANNMQTHEFPFLFMNNSLLIVITDNLNHTEEALKSIESRMNSDIIIIAEQETLKNITYKIYTQHGSREYGFYKLTFVGNWPLCVEANYYSSRKNLTGLELRIPSKISNAKMVLTLEEQSEYLRIERKISFILLNLLRDIHNFGIKTINGTYSTNILEGIDLITEFMTDNLVEIADFVIPAYPYRKAFLLKNPIGSDRNIFSKPFHPKVWYMLLFFMLVMTIALKILLSMSEHLHVPVDDKSWSMAIFILVSTFTQQGLSVIPNLLAYRVFFFTTLLTTLLLLNYYGSSIVSLLLSNPVQQVKSIKDLQKARIKLGREDMPDIYKVSHEIWKNHEFNKSVYSLNEAILLIKNGGFAYYTELAIRYEIMNKALDLFEVCSLIEVSGTTTAYTSFMTPKGSEFTDIFRIRRMIEKGLLKRELSRLMQKRSNCLTPINFTELAMIDVYVAFALYYSGVVLSMVIFFLEHVHVRIQTSKHNLQKIFKD